MTLFWSLVAARGMQMHLNAMEQQRQELEAQRRSLEGIQSVLQQPVGPQPAEPYRVWTRHGYVVLDPYTITGEEDNAVRRYNLENLTDITVDSLARAGLRPPNPPSARVIPADFEQVDEYVEARYERSRDVYTWMGLGDREAMLLISREAPRASFPQTIGGIDLRLKRVLD